MNHSNLIKGCLVVLAFSALSVGLPAAFAPGTFYEDYPFLVSWVNLLPPYNEHLVTDIGGLYTAFGFLFVWSLIKPSRQLILPLCIAWLIAQVLHTAFHVSHLEGFTTTDAVGQTIGFVVLLVAAMIPVSILWNRRN
ncbi:MAG: hypothetical protein ACSLFI_10550 [Solirubrobacterales bacterium]